MGPWRAPHYCCVPLQQQQQQQRRNWWFRWRQPFRSRRLLTWIRVAARRRAVVRSVRAGECSGDGLGIVNAGKLAPCWYIYMGYMYARVYDSEGTYLWSYSIHSMLLKFAISFLSMIKLTSPLDFYNWLSSSSCLIFLFLAPACLPTYPLFLHWHAHTTSTCADFLLHHVPYALVVGTALIYEVNNDVMRAYRYTLPLTLLTSANEAATIGFGLGLSRALDRPNRLWAVTLIRLLLYRFLSGEERRVINRCLCFAIYTPGHSFVNIFVKFVATFWSSLLLFLFFLLFLFLLYAYRYLLLLMLALLVAECFESYVLLAGSRHHTSSNPRLGLQLVALLQLGAPLYHAFGVKIVKHICRP